MHFFVCLSSLQCQNGEPNVLSWCIPEIMSAMPFLRKKDVEKKPDEKGMSLVYI